MTYVGAPPGAFLPYAGVVAPTGWLFCNGAAVSRTTYADLFANIGTAWGVGDGSSTFNLPDFQGRTLVGLGTHASVSTIGANEGISTVAFRRPHHQHSAHTHNVSDPGHFHALTDPGHVHTVNDPGHVHGGVPDTTGGDTGTGGLYGYNFATYSIATRNTTVAATGVTINNKQTGITINGTTTGISISSATSGSGNANDPVDAPAFGAAPFIIKY